MLVEYTQQEVTGMIYYRSSQPQIKMLEGENELIESSFESFSVQPMKRGRVVLQVIPKVAGTFRVLAVFFRVFNIPRFYPTDTDFNSMGYFLAYLHKTETTPERINSIVKLGDEKRFVNRCKESGTINC